MELRLYTEFRTFVNSEFRKNPIPTAAFRLSENVDLLGSPMGVLLPTQI